MISTIETLSRNVSVNKIFTICKMILSQCDIHASYDYVSYAHLYKILGILSLRYVCPDVWSQGTWAKPIGEAPLGHPLLDIRLTEDMPMTSTIETMSRNTTIR